MTKREKLEKLDESLLDAMTELLEKKMYDEISQLNTISTYLKNNQVITPPEEKSSMHDNIKDIIKKK